MLSWLFVPHFYHKVWGPVDKYTRVFCGSPFHIVSGSTIMRYSWRERRDMMRPFTGFTTIASILLAMPNFLWLTGLPPQLLGLLHLAVFGLLVRLLFLCATIADNASDVVWVGTYAGAIGGLVNQLILHSPQASTRIAGALDPYGILASGIWRLDETTLWWPFALALADAIFYGAVAYALFRLAQTRRQGWTPLDN